MGPFETERDAQAAVAALRANPLHSEPTVNLGMLLDAAAAAGVELGAYDRLILGWLANYESSTCAVVAGLITRAHGA